MFLRTQTDLEVGDVPHRGRGGGQEGGHVGQLLVLGRLGAGAGRVGLDGEVYRAVRLRLVRWAAGGTSSFLQLIIIDGLALILDGILGFNFLKF